MRSPELTVAVLDDEPGFRQALGRLLKTHGYRVRTFESGRALLAELDRDRLDCVLLDLHMPEQTGFEVLEILKQRADCPPVIVMTGHDEPGTHERVRCLSAADYLLKPLDEAVLIGAIQRCLIQTR